MSNSSFAREYLSETSDTSVLKTSFTNTKTTVSDYELAMLTLERQKPLGKTIDCAICMKPLSQCPGHKKGAEEQAEEQDTQETSSFDSLNLKPGQSFKSKIETALKTGDTQKAYDLLAVALHKISDPAVRRDIYNAALDGAQNAWEAAPHLETEITGFLNNVCARMDQPYVATNSQPAAVRSASAIQQPTFAASFAPRPPLPC
ncbi:MAG: hypothetical protein ACT4OY_02190 [Alphaproteobacteria bacterium]